MKFYELPELVQAKAADILAKKLDEEIMWGDKDRTEKAKGIAKTVREAFEMLNEKPSATEGSGIGIKV